MHIYLPAVELKDVLLLRCRLMQPNFSSLFRCISLLVRGCVSQMSQAPPSRLPGQLHKISDDDCKVLLAEELYVNALAIHGERCGSAASSSLSSITRNVLMLILLLQQYPSP